MTTKVRCKCGVQVSIADDEWPMRCRCGKVYQRPGPGLVQKAGNFAAAAATFVSTGRKLVDDSTRDFRLAQCLSCVQYYSPEKETCTHPKCGCGIKKKRGIIDKLGWASTKCPIGRWAKASLDSGS